MAHICPPVLSVVVGSGAVEMVNLFSAEPLKKKKKKIFFLIVAYCELGTVNISAAKRFCRWQWHC